MPRRSKESAYEDALCLELSQRGIAYARQVPVSATYKGSVIADRYRLDLLVADEVVVEVKAVEKLTEVHEARLLTYLRHTGKRVGLMLNFNSVRLKDGILRRVL